MSIPGDSATVSSRVGQIRRELFGLDGITVIASTLGIPDKSWERFEAGVSMTDMLMLEFLCLTSVDPRWLLTGEGQKYLSSEGQMHQSNSD